MKIGQAVSEKKMFKDYEILYMYKAQGQGQMGVGGGGGQNFERVCYFDHTLQVSAIGL